MHLQHVLGQLLVTLNISR